MTSDQEKKDKEDGGQEEPRAGKSDPFSQGLGMLSAIKEALEETIAEAREKGAVSSERAREAMRSAVDRAQTAAGEARDRFDFVTQKEYEALRRDLEALRARVAKLEGGDGA